MEMESHFLSTPINLGIKPLKEEEVVSSKHPLLEHLDYCPNYYIELNAPQLA
jgi:hypothetical protein